jgi:hypothetical protein
MKALDYFNSSPGLSYDGERFFKSKIGGFFFIIILMLVLSVFIFFSKKFFERERPKMTVEEYKYWNPPPIDLTNFKFVIMTKYSNKDEFHKEAIRISAVLKQINYKDRTEKEIPLQEIPCVKEDFPNSEDQFESLNLGKGICVDTKNMTIQGSSVNDVFNYISVKYHLCLTGPECLNNTQLSDFIRINKPTAIIYIYDSAFQPTIKNQLKKTYFNSFEVVVTFNNAKFSNVYLSKNELQVEEGYFMDDSLTRIEAIMFESFRDSVSVRTADQANALDINIMCSKKQQIIKLSYMQLSELLANVTAISNSVVLLFNFFVTRFNYSIFQKDLIDECIRFKDEQGSEKPSIFYYKKVITSTSNVLKSESNHRNIPDFNIGEYVSKVKKPMHDMSAGFTFVANNITTCCLNRKYSNKIRLFNDIESKVLAKQDFKQMILRFLDIDLMKYLLFTKTQHAMFDFIKKPVMLKEDDKMSTKTKYGKVIFSHKCSLEDVENSLKHMRAENERNAGNVINSKILEILKEGFEY